MALARSVQYTQFTIEFKTRLLAVAGQRRSWWRMRRRR
jgi:hypothetical protein